MVFGNKLSLFMPWVFCFPLWWPSPRCSPEFQAVKRIKINHRSQIVSGFLLQSQFGSVCVKEKEICWYLFKTHTHTICAGFMLRVPAIQVPRRRRRVSSFVCAGVAGLLNISFHGLGYRLRGQTGPWSGWNDLQLMDSRSDGRTATGPDIDEDDD